MAFLEEGFERPSQLVKRAEYVAPTAAGSIRFFERKVWGPIQLLRNRSMECVDQYEGECLEDEVALINELRALQVPRRVAKDVLRVAAAEKPLNRQPFSDRVTIVEMIILRLESIGENMPR